MCTSRSVFGKEDNSNLGEKRKAERSKATSVLLTIGVMLAVCEIIYELIDYTSNSVQCQENEVSVFNLILALLSFTVCVFEFFTGDCSILRSGLMCAFCCCSNFWLKKCWTSAYVFISDFFLFIFNIIVWITLLSLAAFPPSGCDADQAYIGFMLVGLTVSLLTFLSGCCCSKKRKQKQQKEEIPSKLQETVQMTADNNATEL